MSSAGGRLTANVLVLSVLIYATSSILAEEEALEEFDDATELARLQAEADQAEQEYHEIRGRGGEEGEYGEDELTRGEDGYGGGPGGDPCGPYQDFRKSEEPVSPHYGEAGEGDDIAKWEIETMFPGQRQDYFLPGNSSAGVKCFVHGCPHPHIEVLTKKKQCDIRRGHLANIGEMHWDKHKCIKRMSKLTPRNFFKYWLKKQRPVVMKNAVKDWPARKKWCGKNGDEYLKGFCKGWDATIEMNKNVQRNDRGPFFDDWDFCDFLNRYKTPQWNNSLYVVTTLGQKPRELREDNLLPVAMSCPELAEETTHVGMWMSAGGTSSSLHFDTSENIFVQLDGDKTMLVGDPLYSREAYLDHHNKFGLSPVHTEHVDIERYPRMMDLPWLTAELEAGDILYIPENWWHHVRSRKRNISINIDFNMFSKMQ